MSAPANTFGSITHEGGRWRIECEPHVRTKLRRLFPQVDQRASEVVWLSDSAENSRDLLWFIDRYPMSVSPMKLLKGLSADHVEAESLVHQLLSHVRSPDPFELALPPRDYQAEAATLARIKAGLLLADDVGLGKTATAICPMVMPEYLPALVVTLSHLPPQWVNELHKFAPNLKVHVLKSGRPYDLLERPKRRRGAQAQTGLFDEEQPRLPDVIVCNYHKLAGWAETLAGFIRYVVFDEGQELRVPDSMKYAAAKLIASKARLRMGLSATPIYNYGSEFYNVLDVLLPGALGTREEFVREWCVDDRIKDTKAFGLYLKREGMMLRRTRKDVGRELPPCQAIPHTIQSDRAALDKIKTTAAELARVILADRQQYRGQKFMASEEFNGLLRQATGVAKAPYVAEFVRMVLASEEKVIVYAWHREVYALLMEALAEFKPVMYTGSESPKQKEEAKNAFINGDARVMLMSLRAGAGTDGLQHVCKVGIFAELDWSPGVHVQCLSADTEVLTRDGFRKVDEVFVGDEVAAFDIADGAIRWLPATDKVDRPLAPGEQMFEVQTKKIDVRVTGGHRMVVRRKTRTTSGVGRSNREMVLAQEVAGEARRFIPRSGSQEAPGVPLSDAELRLLGWYLSDGSFNGRCLTFYQAAHQPWNRDLVETLKACGMTYVCRQRRIGKTVLNTYYVQKGTLKRWSRTEVDSLQELSALGYTSERIGAALERSAVAVQKKALQIANGVSIDPVLDKTERGWSHLEPYLDKDLSPLLEDVTRDQLAHLLHGINMGDGAKSERLKNVMRITGVNKTFFDRLQSLCVRRGFSANIYERKSRTSGGNKAYDIFVGEELEASIPRCDKPNGFKQVAAARDERVWCLTNDLGTLVTRRNGKVAIVGNCIGRFHRDEQDEPSIAYFLLAEDGSDPVIADIVGLKKTQLEGVRDPDAELIEELEIDAGGVKRMAESYLAKLGQGAPARGAPEGQEDELEEAFA